MRKIILIRMYTGNQGTLGYLLTNNFSCKTIELPWRDNKQSLSCIPLGTYKCILVNSPKFKLVYNITDVSDRSHILFHAGNVAGDIKKKYKTNSWGCILLGKYIGCLNKQKAVLTSRVTLKKFMKILDNQPFELKIVD